MYIYIYTHIQIDIHIYLHVLISKFAAVLCRALFGTADFKSLPFGRKQDASKWRLQINRFFTFFQTRPLFLNHKSLQASGTLIMSVKIIFLLLSLCLYLPIIFFLSMALSLKLSIKKNFFNTVHNLITFSIVFAKKKKN